MEVVLSFRTSHASQQTAPIVPYYCLKRSCERSLLLGAAARYTRQSFLSGTVEANYHDGGGGAAF